MVLMTTLSRMNRNANLSDTMLGNRNGFTGDVVAATRLAPVDFLSDGCFLSPTLSDADKQSRSATDLEHRFWRVPECLPNPTGPVVSVSGIGLRPWPLTDTGLRQSIRKPCSTLITTAAHTAIDRDYPSPSAQQHQSYQHQVNKAHGYAATQI